MLRPRRGIRPAAHDALCRSAEALGIATEGDAHAVAARIEAAGASGAISSQHAYEMMAWVFAGYAEAEVTQFAEHTALDAGLPARVHPEMAAVLAWASAAGVPVAVVSASPSFMVAAALRAIGHAPAHLCAMTPEWQNGEVRPGVVRAPAPYGPGKPIALREREPTPRVIGAFGDSGFDWELLGCARVPVAIRPKPSLCALAPGLPRLATVVQKV